MSDWLDGMIARRYNVLTELGAWLDPIADKLLVLAVLLALSTMTESTFLWVCNILLILRNVVMNLIRSMCDYLSMSNVVKVSVLGKTKTVFEFFYIAFSLFFLAYSKYKLESVLNFLAMVAVSFSYLSLCFYVKNICHSLTIRYSKG